MKQICTSINCGDNEDFICQNEWNSFEEYEECCKRNGDKKSFPLFFKMIKEQANEINNLDAEVASKRALIVELLQESENEKCNINDAWDVNSCKVCNCFDYCKKIVK